MSMNQLTLWEPEPMPDTYEFPFTWADGCQDRPQLERLATLLKQHGHTRRDDNGKLCLFKIIDTRIDDGQVLATCVLNTPLMQKLGMNKMRPVAEDDEDC